MRPARRQARNRSGGAGPPRRCLNARLGARLVEPRRAADFAGGMRSRLAGEGGFLSRGCVLGLRAGALATAARCFCVGWPPRLARALPTRVDVLAAGVAGLLTHVAGSLLARTSHYSTYQDSAVADRAPRSRGRALARVGRLPACLGESLAWPGVSPAWPGSLLARTSLCLRGRDPRSCGRALRLLDVSRIQLPVNAAAAPSRRSVTLLLL